MAVLETFGSPLTEIVKKQFYNRSRVNLRTLSYIDRTSDESETVVVGFNDRYLRKHLFNSSWINLISSVNVIDEQADEPDKRPELAKRLILSGGTLYWDGEKLVKREGVDFVPPDSGYGIQSAYNVNTLNGIRPMPGITGFKIVSKNLLGTLREATIDFVVWSAPELEDIEKLYLRPGYHAIVEWGHSYGLDSEGKESPFPIATFDNYNKFFDEIPADEVYKIIQKTRDVNDGNYDGFLGIIKNFSWSFRPDGGYDCSINVISKGEILESLTVRSGITSLDDIPVDQSAQTEEDFLETNILTRFVKIIKEAGNNADIYRTTRSPKVDERKFTIKDIFKNKYVDIVSEIEKFSESRKDTNGNIPVLGYVKVFSEGNKKTWWQSVIGLFGGDTNINQRTTWITLEFLLYIINYYIRSSSTSKKFSEFNVERENKQELFLFDNFINCSPDTCFVPQRPSKTYSFNLSITGTLTGTRLGLGGKDLPLFPLIVLPDLKDSKRILDILISIEQVEGQLRNYIHTLEDPEELDILGFVKSLLKIIETNIGGINEFVLEYSEEFNKFTIVDRRAVNQEQDLDNIPVLNVFGAGSIALDISLQTKITNKLGAQISIAAQGPDGQAQFNSSMPEFKKWNRNLIDRFDSDIVVGSTDSTNTTDNNELVTKVNNFEEKVLQAYVNWWKGIFEPEESYWSSILTQCQTFYSMIASDFKTYKKLPPQGIVPTVLTLKVEGIGGIKIGQTFKLNKGILPSRYNGFGYIVTGIEHSIENNKWTTSIVAQTYYLEKPRDQEQEKAKEKLGRFQMFFPEFKPEPTPPIQQQTQTPLLGTDAQRFWTLVAICSREDNNPQGWADVAQSIYNRVASGAYENDVIKQILATGQYEPTWKSPLPGSKNQPNKEWKTIVDVNSAAKATNSRRDYLIRVALALQSLTLQQNASNFIKGRTDFFGPRQPAIKMTANKSRVQRNANSNQFGFSFNYFQPNGGSPAPVPSFISAIKV